KKNYQLICEEIEKIQNSFQPLDVEGLAKAIAGYLAMIVSKQADFNSSLARWANHMENSVATFGRQALPMLWDYCEANAFAGSFGSWDTHARWLINAVNSAMGLPTLGKVKQSSAMALPFPSNT